MGMCKNCGEESSTGVYCLDVIRLVHKWRHSWNIWIAPLMKDHIWYSRSYFEETMEAFDNTEKAMSGINVVFMVMPPKTIVPDHK